MSEPLYDELAAIAGALSNPRRLRALNLLFQGPKPIETLAELLGESEANTAAHMKVLRTAGLVTPRREGKYVFQEANSSATLQLFLALREAGEALSPSLRLMNDQPDEQASPVTTEGLAELVASRAVLLLDLRPELEFQAGHIPGARSLPMSVLADRLEQLPRRKRIVAYCRGKYCPNARAGVGVLRKAGLRAERLTFGVPEWRAGGHALETGAKS